MGSFAVRALFAFLIFASVSFTFHMPAHAVDGTQAAKVAASMDAADKKDWVLSRRLAQQAGGQAALDLADWRLLSAGEGSWPQYRDFIARAGDWPNLKRIRKEGERTMPRGVTLAEIDAFVGTEGIQTGTGAVRRAEALIDAGRAAEADETVIRAWRELSLDPNEFSLFRSRFSGAIRPHHQARADMLLWRGLTSEAMSMKPLVSDGWARLIDARVKLRRRADGVDAAINAIPGSLAGDPGLAYERFVWRMRKSLYDSATDLIQSQTSSPASLGRPDEWGPRRRLLVRRLYRQGQHIAAYNLANQNHMTGGSDYSDLEWLAGWIALRRMSDPDRAIAHFTRFNAVVETPISLGRGAYWMGRAYEAKGDQAQARQWYLEGAKYQTSFYGQLAAEAVGAPIDPFLTAGTNGNWQNTGFAGRTVTEATRLLSRGGDRRRAHWFLTHIASTLSSYDDLAGIAHLATELGRDDAAIRISKIAAGKGHVLEGYYYPVTGLARFNQGVEPALAMAIGRQESELNPEAISPAGARGLMQLMPATAQKVSGWVGVPYSKAQLTTDWQYNATLGQTYLARRLDQFGGSVAMAAAAYNAGAGRVDQWIAAYGDPRSSGIDWIDWLETIPFNETRNYVQRVLEGLNVYRNRIAGQPVAFNTRRDALGQ
ncbi:MAG: transglycosylase SLT domain-containing protein [Pseudomonadota bacterium]